MSVSSHGDKLRGIIARAQEFGDVAEMDDAAVELSALLAENQQLRSEVEHLRDRAVCSGCGSDVDESGICRYEGCDDGQMIPASDLPGALREACDAQTERWEEWRFDWEALRAEAKGLATENQQLRDALRELHNEVDCRIEHGAESGGHLEYVRDRLAAVRVEEA